MMPPQQHLYEGLARPADYSIFAPVGGCSNWKGCSKWKKTLAYLLVLPGSRARIVRCGGRYDPQLVKRSSE